MSTLSPRPPQSHPLSPLPPPSAPQTPGASSADDTSDSDADPAPFTPFTPYTPGPDSDPALAGTPTPSGSSLPPSQFLGLKASQRQRPPGALGRVELLLEQLAEELNTLQTRAEAVYPPRREEDGPLIQGTVREVVGRLGELQEAAEGVGEWVPVQVLEYLDEGRNPDDYTRTMLELTAAENQFTNGKVHAVHSYLELLSSGLAEAFPAMAEHLPPATIPLDDLQPAPPAVTSADGESARGGAATAGEGVEKPVIAGERTGEGEEVDVGMELDAVPSGVGP